MKSIALTVLVYEGPIARSYLGALHASGCRVERIVLMVQKRDPSHHRQVAPWLPAMMRRPLARTIQDLRLNHWPREILRRHGALCRPWLDALGQTYGFDAAVYRYLTEPPNYTRYTDHVDEIFVDGLTDRALEQHLRSLPGRRTILFTGGGMVPASLLNVPQLRFMHVHPGVLPNVRGADGLLWSLLLRGRPGATAFYMGSGLDTGDIILASDLDIPPLPPGFAALDLVTAYRLLYAFVDPMLRAILLRRVVATNESDLFSLPAVAQRQDEGTTFHFMNERLRRYAFDRLQALAALRATAGSASEA